MQQKSLSDYFGDNILSDSPEGRKSSAVGGTLINPPAPPEYDGYATLPLMEQILHPENLETAWKKVKRNKGAPGVDGVKVGDFPAWREKYWSAIADKLRNGKYRPYPVKRVEIPKPNGGVRLLGIPTVLDRFIQQAVLQVLQPRIDPTFSDHSHGFRPGRSAHDAIREAKRYVEDGYRYVVDMDLEKFFDKVNHDILLSRVSRHIDDKQVLRLIRRYLQSGIMVDGICVSSEEGVPQGGPLSPLLANILLDDLDKELERRGHRFVRYADDCNIFVRTKEAGKRVFKNITNFLETRLKLRVNQNKSAVDTTNRRPFLGFKVHKDRKGVRITIPPKTVKRFRAKVKAILVRRGRGQKLDSSIKELNWLIRGWAGYFGIIDNPSRFQNLDGWIRHRLRCILWRQWKRPRTRARNLLSMGVPEKKAYIIGYSSKGPWRLSYSRTMNFAFRNYFFRKLGLLGLVQMWHYKRGLLYMF